MYGCYEGGNGVAMSRDEWCCEHAGGIEVGRCIRVMSMQAQIEWGWTDKGWKNDRWCREHAGGIEVVRWANTMSMQTHIKWGWTNKQSSEPITIIMCRTVCAGMRCDKRGVARREHAGVYGGGGMNR